MRRCTQRVSSRCIAVDGMWNEYKYQVSKTGRVKSHCTPCNSEIVKRWRAANPSKAKILRENEREKRLADTAARAKHREENPVPERARKTPQRYLDSKKQYYQENKAAFRLRERAREKSVVVEMTQAEWVGVCNKYDNKCLACGAEEVTLDHVIPLCDGGRHHISNVQPLCLTCNSSKGRKHTDYRP
jgi:hypothetical protein